MLCNIERARQVMVRRGLDAIVAAFPENIYYLSDYWGPMLLMSRNYSLYAVLPRDERAPAALVMPSSGLYHLEHQPTWMPNVVSFSVRVTPRLSEPRDYDSTLEEIAEDELPPIQATHSPMPYPVREGAEMAARDQRLLARFAEHEGRMEPTALYALKRALKEAGVAGGRVGFDDPRVGGWLAEAGLKRLTSVDALNVFKEIRMVKTPEEIALLTRAGQATEAALNSVIDAIEPGLPLDAISHIHARRMAELGGRSVFIIANIRGLATGEVEPNELIKLDAVGSYREYRGDVGRSVICGEPTGEMLRRNRAVMRGLEVAYDTIRPGKTAAEIAQLTLDTLAKEGFPGFVIASPHSVGLEHTDHPTSLGPELPGAHPLVFEENMVFTLDMPYHEFGWGTMHVEDMVIVRRDGCEPITSRDTALRIKPVN